MSRLPIALLLLLFVALCAPAPSAHAGEPPSVPLQFTRYGGQGQDMCLQTFRRPGGANNRLVQAPCGPMGGLQMYTLVKWTGGGYRIVNTETNGCMDVSGARTHAGAPILDWPCHNGDNQRWEIDYNGGMAKFRAWHSKRCVDFDKGMAVQVDCKGWGWGTGWTTLAGPVWMLRRQQARLPYRDFGLRLVESGLCMTDDPNPVTIACEDWRRIHLTIDTTETDNAGREFQFRRGSQCLVDTQGGFAAYMACPNTASSKWRLMQVMPDPGVTTTGESTNYWQVKNIATGLCLSGAKPWILQSVPCDINFARRDAVWSFVTPDSDPAA